MISMGKMVYHYTSMLHIDAILKDGYLKLTPSNLVQPTDLHLVNVNGIPSWVSQTDSIKPVVWLTSSPIPEGHGLECGSNMRKKEVRITLSMKDSYEWWEDWSVKNRMNKNWKKKFIRGFRYGTWYVSEEVIPVEDFLLVENLKTGEILYKR